jgi:hypothetical protein
MRSQDRSRLRSNALLASNRGGGGDPFSDSKDSKMMYESQRRRGLASKSFSPMSNTSRGNNNPLVRSSVKKGYLNQHEQSLLNMSNEVSQMMMMRSLSPSIQENGRGAKNQKRKISSLSPTP